MCLQWLRFKVTLQELEHAGISSNLQTLWKTQHVWKWKQVNLSPCYSLGTCISGFGGHPSLCGFAFLLRARLVSWLVVVVPSGKVDDKLGGCGLQAGWRGHHTTISYQTKPHQTTRARSLLHKCSTPYHDEPSRNCRWYHGKNTFTCVCDYIYVPPAAQTQQHLGVTGKVWSEVELRTIFFLRHATRVSFLLCQCTCANSNVFWCCKICPIACTANPSNPSNPSNLANPANLSTLANPSNHANPANPSISANPVNAANPSNSGQPCQSCPSCQACQF